MGCKEDDDYIDEKMRKFTWTPLEYLSPSYYNEKTFCVLKLNTSVMHHGMITTLWEKATVRAVTDGAANEIYSLLMSGSLSALPELVSGDFDSAKPEVLQFFREKNVKVISTPDQDETDFTKCIRELMAYCQQSNIKLDRILVFDSLGGRFDHVMGNIHTLFHARDMGVPPVSIINCDGYIQLLEQGEHEIHINKKFAGPYCGLIPIGCPCNHVTTTGLNYNLDDGRLAFGEVVSTSNGFSDSPVVTVKTDKPLLWTMGIQSCNNPT